MLLWLLGCPTPAQDTADPAPCKAQDGQVLLDGEPADSLIDAVEQATPWSTVCLGAGEHILPEDDFLEFQMHEVVPGKGRLLGVGAQTRIVAPQGVMTAVGTPDHLEIADLTLVGVGVFGGSLLVSNVQCEEQNVLFSQRGTVRDSDLGHVTLFGTWTVQDGVSTTRVDLDRAHVWGLRMQGAEDVAVQVLSPSILVDAELIGNPAGAIGIQVDGALELYDVTFDGNGCDLGVVADATGFECTQDQLGQVEALVCDASGGCQ